MNSTAMHQGFRTVATVRRFGVCVLSTWVVLSAGLAFAQVPAATAPAPPPPWTGNVAAGLSLTSGNTSTTNFNVGFDLTFDPKKKNAMKWTGLYLRGEQNSVLAVDRLSLGYRDQYSVSARTFVFGQIDYVRDTFKNIDYLVAPTGGVGFKVVNSKTTQFSVDAGAGAVIEKNTGVNRTTSGAITAGEQLTHQLTTTATLKQSLANLWKTSNMSDSIHTFAMGLALKVSDRTQVSIDLLDTFRRLVPSPTVKKNDVAFVVSFGTKF